MGFLDKLTDSISTGTAKVADKAKEVTEIATLTAAVEKEKVNADKLYKELGQKFYEQYKDLAAEKFPEDAAKLDESVAKIDDAKEAIRKAKGIQLCPKCSREVARDTKFCPECGTEMPVIVEEEPVAKGVTCPSCGAVLPKDTAFCTKCGTKLSE